MAFVSARYMPNDPIALPDASQQVQAIDDQGVHWSLTEDSQLGDWVEYLANGGMIDPYVAPPVVGSDVNTERDRRIYGGFVYMNHMFQSDEFSQRNMADASQAADLVIAEDYRKAETYRWQIGATEDFYWIVEDNTKLPMTAYDVRGLAQNMLRFKQRMIRCGRTIKDMYPIPANYTDDMYWVFEEPPEIPD